MHVHFAEPRWLWAGGLACLTLGILYVRAGRARARAVALLGGSHAATSLSAGRRRLKAGLALIGTAALFVAVARPQAGFRWEETRRQGIDLMFAVDTSKSMLAADLRPDRLTRAKLAVRDLVRELPGERFGLIAFAGDAFVQAPMTTDEAVFEEALDALDPSIIPRGGTDLAAAIRTAEAAMASEPDRRKLLILLSDGEDLAGDARAAATEAAAKGLTIHAVGVGTSAGALLSARDEAGQPVRSRLDEATLAAVAGATHGTYVPLGPSGRGLEELYRTALAKLPRSTTSERWRRVYTERFQIPLAAATACLLAELVLGERRRGRRRAVAVAGAVLLLAGAGRARAETAPDLGAYNAGTGAYRQRDFGAAQQRFQAATRSGDLSLQENAYYDLGNARFRIGQATEKQNPAATMEAWKGALAAYDGALALNHGDGDARFNRDLVARKLAELEQQNKQKEQRRQPQDQQKGQGAKQPTPSKSAGGPAQQPSSAGGQGQPQGQAQSSTGDGQGQQQGQSSPAGGQGRPQAQNQPSPGGEDQARPQQQNQPPSGRAQERQQRQAQGQNQPPSGSGREQSAPNLAGSAQPEPAEPAPRGQSAPTPAVEGPGPGQKKEPAGEQAAGDRQQAGALSRGEADQLLRSLDGQMQRLPLAAFGKRPAAPDEQPTKDW